MFITFLHNLKESGVPVSIKEYLDFLAGLDAGITNLDTNSFYHFAKASLVKDERYFDKFDKTFSKFFEGALEIGEELLKSIPEEWIRDALQKQLTEEEKNVAKSDLLTNIRSEMSEGNPYHCLWPPLSEEDRKAARERLGINKWNKTEKGKNRYQSQKKRKLDSDEFFTMPAKKPRISR